MSGGEERVIKRRGRRQGDEDQAQTCKYVKHLKDWKEEMERNNVNTLVKDYIDSFHDRSPSSVHFTSLLLSSSHHPSLHLPVGWQLSSSRHLSHRLCRNSPGNDINLKMSGWVRVCSVFQTLWHYSLSLPECRQISLLFLIRNAG